MNSPKLLYFALLLSGWVGLGSRGEDNADIGSINKEEREEAILDFAAFDPARRESPHYVDVHSARPSEEAVGAAARSGKKKTNLFHDSGSTDEVSTDEGEGEFYIHGWRRPKKETKAAVPAQAAMWQGVQGFHQDSTEAARSSEIQNVQRKDYRWWAKELHQVRLLKESGRPTPTATPTGTVTGTPASTPSPSASPTNSESETATSTPTATSSASASSTNSGSPSGSSSSSGSPTSSATATSTASSTSSMSPSVSPSSTFSPTSSATTSSTTTGTETSSQTATSTASSSASASVSGTSTQTVTPTSSPTTTGTETGSQTSTTTPSASTSASVSGTSSSTFTATSSATRTDTGTGSQTFTATQSPSVSSSLSFTSSLTPTTTTTSASTDTETGSQTPTNTKTTSASASFSATATISSTSTNTETGSQTPTNTKTVSASASVSATATISSTSTDTETGSQTPTNTKTVSASASFSPTATISSTSTNTGTASQTPTNTKTTSASDSISPTTTISSTSTNTRTASQTPTNTKTVSASASFTSTATISSTSSNTGTGSQTPTNTKTTSASDSFSPTATISSTSSNTGTASQTPTNTKTTSASDSFSPTATISSTSSNTGTASQTATSTKTTSASASFSATATISSTSSNTETGSLTSTGTPTPSSSISSSVTGPSSITGTPSASQSQSPSMMASSSQTITETATFTPTSTDLSSHSPSRSSSSSSLSTLSVTITATATSSVSTQPSASATQSAAPPFSSSPSTSRIPPSLSLSGSRSALPSLTETRTISVSPSFTRSPSITPTITRLPTASVTGGFQYEFATSSACSSSVALRLSSSSRVLYTSGCSHFVPALGSSSTFLGCYSPSGLNTAANLAAPDWLQAAGKVFPGSVCFLSCNCTDSPCLPYGPIALICDIDGTWRAATSNAWYVGGSLAQAPSSVRSGAQIFSSLVTLPAALLSSDGASVPVSTADATFSFVPDCEVVALANQPSLQCLPQFATQPALSTGSQCNGSVSISVQAGSAPSQLLTIASASAWSSNAIAAEQFTSISNRVAAPVADYSLLLVFGVRPHVNLDIRTALGLNDGEVWLPQEGGFGVLTLPLSDPSSSLIVAGNPFVPLIGQVVSNRYLVPGSSSSLNFSTQQAGNLLNQSAHLLAGLVSDGQLDEALLDPALALTVYAGNLSTMVADSLDPPWVIAAENVSVGLSTVLRDVSTFASDGHILGFVSTCATITPIVFSPSFSSSTAASVTSHLLLGEAFPASRVSFVFSDPPADGETVFIQCGLGDLQSYTVIQPTSQSIASSNFMQSESTLTFTIAVTNLPTSVVGLSRALQVSLICNISSQMVLQGRPAYSAIPQVSIPALILRTVFPFFSDIVVETKSGDLRSSWSDSLIPVPAVTCNSTVDSTIQAMCQPSTNDSDATPFGDLPEEYQFDLIKGVEQAPDTTLPFVLSLSGATNVTLIADRSQRTNVLTGFIARTKVLINGIPCLQMGISTDGLQLRVETPPFSEICSDPLHCTSAIISILPPGLVPSDLLGSDRNGTLAQAVAQGEQSIGVPVMCPPFCPGRSGQSTFKISSATSSGGASRRLDVDPNIIASLAVSDYGTVLQPSQPTSLTSGGLVYVVTCTAAGFADPTSGVCTNASNPLHLNCAFGGSDLCRACPFGSLCPGGFRAWPVPGYYTSAEASGSVTACSPPASERCIGWNTDLGAVQCGDTYRQGSTACQACIFSYYADKQTGRCLPCPDPQNPWNVVRPILIFIASLVGVGIGMFGIVVIVMKRIGGSVHEGANIAIKFVLNTFVAVQAVVTLGREAESGLPPSLRAIYDAFGFLQFEGVSLPPECLAVSTGPFFTLYVQSFVLLVILSTLLALVWLTERGRLGGPLFSGASVAEKQSQVVPAGIPQPASNLRSAKAAALVRRIMFLLLILLYATIASTALSSVWCINQSIPVRAYLELECDGSSLERDGIPASLATLQACNDDPFGTACGGSYLYLDSPMTVSVLTASPEVVCGESQHKLANKVAWSLVTLYLFLYPLMSFVYIRQKIRSVMVRGPRRELFETALANQRNQQREYLRSRSGVLLCAGYSRLWLCGLPEIDQEAAQSRCCSRGVRVFPTTLAAYNAGVPEIDPVGVSNISGEGLIVAVIPGPGSTCPVVVQMPPANSPPSIADSGQIGPEAGSQTVAPALESRGQEATAASNQSEKPIEDTPRSPAASPPGSPTVTTLVGESATPLKTQGEPVLNQQFSIPPPDTLIDHESRLVNAVAFHSYFGADFRPSKFYFIHLNLALLLYLQVISLAFKDSPTNLSYVLQCFLIEIGLASFLMLTLGWKPFKPREHAARFVAIYGLGLAMLEAVVNCVNSAVKESFFHQAGELSFTIDQLPDVPLVRLLLVVAYITVVASAGFFFVILWGYIRVLSEVRRRSQHRRSSLAIQALEKSTIPSTPDRDTTE